MYTTYPQLALCCVGTQRKVQRESAVASVKALDVVSSMLMGAIWNELRSLNIMGG